MRLSVRSDADAEKTLSVREKIGGHRAEPGNPSMPGINRESGGFEGAFWKMTHVKVRS